MRFSAAFRVMPLAAPVLLTRTTVPCASIEDQIEALDDRIASAESFEAALATQFANAITNFRQSVFDAVPRVNIPALGSEYQVGNGISGLRTSLLELLAYERATAGVLLLVLTVMAVMGSSNARGGTVVLRRATPGDEAVFRKGFSDAEAASFDAGRDLEPRPAASRRRTSASPLTRVTRVSGKQWLVLVLCVALDAVGDASLFFPESGELLDLGFALLQARLLRLFFAWPALSTLAFWEESLPLCDFLPTATLGWVLVVVAGWGPRRAFGAAVPPFGLAVDADTGLATGLRPPLADRRAFLPTEEYMREGSRPWED